MTNTRTTEHNMRANRRRTVDVATTLYFLLDVVELLLALRLVLKLLNVSAENGFAQLIYAVTQPFVTPFQNIATWHAPRFDSSILLAMVAYALCMYLFVQFLHLFDET